MTRLTQSASLVFMSAPKPTPQMCEVCHEREATAAAVLSFGKGPNIQLTNLCQPCLDAHIAKAPRSLQTCLLR